MNIEIIENNGQLMLFFDYNLTFIEAIKSNIPARERQYLPKNDISNDYNQPYWIVNNLLYKDLLCNLAKMQFEYAFYVHDNVKINLITGKKTEQITLF